MNWKMSKTERKWTVRLLIVAIAVCVIALVIARVAEHFVRTRVLWTEHYEEGFSLLRSERYAEAEEEFEDALRLAEKLFPQPASKTANNLYNLGVSYYKQEKFLEAEGVFLRAVDMTAEVFGAKHKSVMDSLGYLSRIHLAENRLAEAEKVCLRIVDMKVEAYGGKHESVAVDLSGLSNIYYAQNRLEEAIAVSKRVLAIHEETLGPDDIAVARVLLKLGIDYSQLDPPTHYAEAEAHLLRAMRIHEQNPLTDEDLLNRTRSLLKHVQSLRAESMEENVETRDN